VAVASFATGQIRSAVERDGPRDWRLPMSRGARRMAALVFCLSCGNKRRTVKGLVRGHYVSRTRMGRDGRMVGGVWWCAGGKVRGVEIKNLTFVRLSSVKKVHVAKTMLGFGSDSVETWCGWVIPSPKYGRREADKFCADCVEARAAATRKRLAEPQ